MLLLSVDQLGRKVETLIESYVEHHELLNPAPPSTSILSRKYVQEFIPSGFSAIGSVICSLLPPPDAIRIF